MQKKNSLKIKRKKKMSIEDLEQITQKGFLSLGVQIRSEMKEMGTETRSEMKEGFKIVDMRFNSLEDRVGNLEKDVKLIKESFNKFMNTLDHFINRTKDKNKRIFSLVDN